MIYIQIHTKGAFKCESLHKHLDWLSEQKYQSYAEKKEHEMLKSSVTGGGQSFAKRRKTLSSGHKCAYK